MNQSFIAHSAIAMETEILDSRLVNEWLRATYHITPSRNAFVSYIPLSAGDKIKDANGGLGTVVGIGNVILEVDDGILELEDVRHIPSLTSNLVPMGFWMIKDSP